MFDMLTTDQLHEHHDQAWNENTRLYKRCTSMPVTHPAYPATFAAMTETGEHLRAIGTEIRRRDTEEHINA